MQFVHKFEFAPFRTLVFSLCVLCGLCVSISAQSFRTLKDGVEYAEVTKEISGKPVNMNLLRLDLKKVRLDVHHAMDAAIGTEKTSSIATRHGAFAAINAGFFRLDKSDFAGDSVGAFQIDGKVLSEATNDRIAMIINNPSIFMGLTPPSHTWDFYDEVYVRFGRLKTRKDVVIGEKVIQVDGVNRERSIDDFVVYTPEFGSSTLTKNEGAEIVVSNWRIVQIVRDKGNNVIPRDGFVISITGKRLSEFRDSWKPKSVVIFKPEFYVDDPLSKPRIEWLRTPEDVVTGVPQLIKDSKIDITWEQEKASKSFVETRHPRTAVAKLKDGKFLMITVDGRSEQSAGIDLYDLAKLLLELGATDAMNLDGGGSTTMFVDGKVVNKPSDKEGERKVSDAILVTLRKKK